MGVVRTASLSLVVAALVAFAATPAQAQDAEKARQLFQQGSKYYDLGQFDKAIEAWQQGYDQKPDPGFLYNIAQAYRQKQDAAKAIFFYKGYLRNSPKAHNRAEVEQKIAALQKQAGDTGTQTTPPPPGNNRRRPATRRRRPTTTAAAAQLDGDGDVTDRADRHGGATAAAGVHGRAAHDGRRGHAAADVHEHAPLRRDGGHRSGLLAVGRQRHARSRRSCSTGWPATPSETATSRFRFRLGGLLGYTFLGANEDNSNVTFVSFMLDPTLEIRLTQSGRLYADRRLRARRPGAVRARAALEAAGAERDAGGQRRTEHGWCRASALPSAFA